MINVLSGWWKVKILDAVKIIVQIQMHDSACGQKNVRGKCWMM
jgi:hypothetical protein